MKTPSFHYLLAAVIWIAPSAGFAASAQLLCQFVPYSSCILAAQIDLDKPFSLDALDSVEVLFEVEAVEPHPGLYEFNLRMSGEGMAESRNLETKLRIRDQAVMADDYFTDLRGAANWVITAVAEGYDRLEITSQRIPLLVNDASVEESYISLRLLFDGREQASSRIRMRPTGGCWFDEAACLKPRSDE